MKDDERWWKLESSGRDRWDWRLRNVILYRLARFGSKERVHTVSPVGDREWDKMKTVSSRHIYDYIKVVLVLLLHAALCGSICVTKSCTWYLVTGRQWQCVLGDRINISRGLNLLNSLSPWTSLQQVNVHCHQHHTIISSPPRVVLHLWGTC